MLFRSKQLERKRYSYERNYLSGIETVKKLADDVKINAERLGDHGGRFSAGELGESARLEGDRDEGRERVLGVGALLGGIGFVLLDVHVDGGVGGTRAGEAEDEARAVGEDEADALLFGDGTVDGIRVLKVVGKVQFVVAVLVALLGGGSLGAEGFNQIGRASCRERV